MKGFFIPRASFHPSCMNGNVAVGVGGINTILEQTTENRKSFPTEIWKDQISCFVLIPSTENEAMGQGSCSDWLLSANSMNNRIKTLKNTEMTSNANRISNCF